MKIKGLPLQIKGNPFIFYENKLNMDFAGVLLIYWNIISYIKNEIKNKTIHL